MQYGSRAAHPVQRARRTAAEALFSAQQRHFPRREFLIPIINVKGGQSEPLIHVARNIVNFAVQQRPVVFVNGLNQQVFRVLLRVQYAVFACNMHFRFLHIVPFIPVPCIRGTKQPALAAMPHRWARQCGFRAAAGR